MNRRIVWKAAGVIAAVAVVGTAASPVGAGGSQHWKHDRGVTFRVDSGSDTVDAEPGDGRCADARKRCTLRAAVQEANATSKGVTIVLHRSVDLRIANAAGDEELAATGDLDVTGDVTVKGSRWARVDAKGIDRAFEVMAGGSLDLTAVKITGGAVGGGADPVAGSGGAIANHGELSLSYVTIEGNRAIGPMASGGGVLNTGSMTVERSTFADNEATRAGGAIEANGGSTKIDLSTMRKNRTGPTPGNGGALHLTGPGFVEVARSTVALNVAAAEGGGLWNSDSGTMVVRGGSYVDNVAAGDAADNGGGALFNDGGTMTVDGAYLGKNDATGAAGSGGGILNAGGSLVVSRTTIEKNTASRAGGGIEAVAGTTELATVRLLRNSTGAAPGNGGGFHLTGPGTVDIRKSDVFHNTAAAEGGGLWNSADGTMTVESTSVRKNRAPDGPNVFNDGGTFVLNGQPVPNSNA